jgi:anaerobic magnesium-protoporphyrin IX monomethyl ester cyclase
MKVLLINPLSEKAIDSEEPLFIRRHEGVFPPIGLMYIAAYLKKETDCEVKILDTLADKMDYGEIKESIIDFGPDIAGITAYTNNLRDVIIVSDLVKKVNKNTRVCLGGPHVNIFPREALNIPSVDFLVFGEGEISFTELVKALMNGSSWERIEGIAFKNNNNHVFTGTGKDIENPDILPFPDRSAADYKKYYSLLGKSSFMTTMLSSRGCPFSCSFCGTPRGKYRARSPENIADEMEECLSLGINEVHFVDDTFNADADRVMKLCGEIIKRGLKIKWSFRGRACGVTERFLAELKKAGCYRIHLGVETSTDEGLKILNKGITVKEIRDAFKLIRRSGIESAAYFLIGCPHEKDRKDVLRTIKFSMEIDPDFCLFNILTLYPGTGLCGDAVRKGFLREDHWKDFAMDPSGDFKLPFWEEHLRPEELKDLLDLAYRKFYLRLKFAARFLTASGSVNILIKRIKAGLNCSIFCFAKNKL